MLIETERKKKKLVKPRQYFSTKLISLCRNFLSLFPQESRATIWQHLIFKTGIFNSFEGFSFGCWQIIFFLFYFIHSPIWPFGDSAWVLYKTDKNTARENVFAFIDENNKTANTFLFRIFRFAWFMIRMLCIAWVNEKWVVDYKWYKICYEVIWFMFHDFFISELPYAYSILARVL